MEVLRQCGGCGVVWGVGTEGGRREVAEGGRCVFLLV